MKTIATAALMACLTFGASTVYAQPAPPPPAPMAPAPMAPAPMAPAPMVTPPPARMDQGAMAPRGKQGAKMTRECQDRVATQKGVKRVDAAVSGEVTAECAHPMPAGKKRPMRHHDRPMKDAPMRPDMAPSAPR